MESASPPHPVEAARRAAARLIEHARTLQEINLQNLKCIDCKCYPNRPITPRCGHTRCTRCVLKKVICPCGVRAPYIPYVNVLINDLLEKICKESSSVTKQLNQQVAGGQGSSSSRVLCENIPSAIPVSTENYKCRGNKMVKRCRGRRLPSSLAVRTKPANKTPILFARNTNAQFEYAKSLIKANKQAEALPHLALTAAAAESPFRDEARHLLESLMSTLSGKQDPRRLLPESFRTLKVECGILGVTVRDLECIICYNLLKDPITTACGHTFCKLCLIKLFDIYKQKPCPLCSAKIYRTYFITSRPNIFVQEILNNLKKTSELINTEEYVPILQCTTAFPLTPCPLLFTPTKREERNRSPPSSNKKIGMIDNNGIPDYGTVLEIRDRLTFEDGSEVAMTVGLYRFKILEMDLLTRSRIARIEKVVDNTPTEPVFVKLLSFALRKVSLDAKIWLSQLPPESLARIESSYGPIPQFTLETAALNTPDGPAWLWWLISVLPISSKIQTLILSKTDLFKRVAFVQRVFHMLLEQGFSP